MAIAKLCAAKPSAQVLAQSPKPEVGASSDAHLLLSCEAYLEATGNSSQSYSIYNHIITLIKSNHASIWVARRSWLSAPRDTGGQSQICRVTRRARNAADLRVKKPGPGVHMHVHKGNA